MSGSSAVAIAPAPSSAKPSQAPSKLQSPLPYRLDQQIELLHLQAEIESLLQSVRSQGQGRGPTFS